MREQVVARIAELRELLAQVPPEPYSRRLDAALATFAAPGVLDAVFGPEPVGEVR